MPFNRSTNNGIAHCDTHNLPKRNHRRPLRPDRITNGDSNRLRLHFTQTNSITYCFANGLTNRSIDGISDCYSDYNTNGVTDCHSDCLPSLANHGIAHCNTHGCSSGITD